jgi:hypothetical protein
VNTARDGAKWFSQPVLWIGALIFLASLVACVVTIMVALRHVQ